MVKRVSQSSYGWGLWIGYHSVRALPLFALGVLVVLSGCAVLMHSGWLPDRPNYFETHHYSHAQHLNEVGMDCDFCHYSVRESVDNTQKHTPPMKTCLKCHNHQGEYNQDQCQVCHIVPEAEIPHVHTDLHFSHKQHLALAGMEDACEMCHTTNRQSTRVGDRNLPQMQVCLNCHYHEQQYQDLLCINCHTDLMSVGLKPMSRFAHQGNFLKDHQHYAWSQTDVCAQCHAQSDCMECHADNRDELTASMKFHGRVDRSWVHEPDYLSRHFIEARQDPALCISCHRPSFCESCHKSHGISDIPDVDQYDTRLSPHPPDFDNERSPNFHGRIARREIANCASCHDQGKDSICIECHAVFTDSINPHPRGWSSDKDMYRDRPCLYCHVEDGKRGR